MRRFLVTLFMVIAVVPGLVSTSRAQQIPRPPSPSLPTLPGGGAQPMACCGGGGTAPVVTKLQPANVVYTSSVTVQIDWCDNGDLNPSSRWVTVNSVNQSTDYQTATPYGTCNSHATSTVANVSLNIGSNVIQAHICDTGLAAHETKDSHGALAKETGEHAPECTTNGWTIIRREGEAPIVSLAPYSADLQDYSRCAASCFALTYAQSTVPYFSLDAARSVTLAYNSDRVDPRPFLHVDVTHGGGGGATPSYFYLKARRSGGSWITFLNNEQELRFAVTSTSAALRLGGQFNATANYLDTTRAYTIEIVVGAKYATSVEETVVTTRLIVVNENNSPIARGWTLGGIQRAYYQNSAPYGVLITEGDGSAAFFASSGGFISPAGEFSSLSVTGSGSSTVYTRTWPDSTRVRFNYQGYMTSVVNRWGDSTRVTYDGSNRVSQVIDPTGNYHQLAYGSYGLTSIAALGRTTTLWVRPDSTLGEIRDPDGLATQFQFDVGVGRRLNRIYDRTVALTTFGYDSQSWKLASSTAPAVPIFGVGTASPIATFSAWQRVGVPYSATSSTAFSTVLASQVRGSVTDAAGHPTRFTVNGFGQPLVTTDSLGNTTSVSYSPEGLPTLVTSPTGATVATAYNANGLPTSITPSGQAATYFAYTTGRWGQPDSTWGAGRPRVRYKIGANGRIDTTWTASAPPSIYSYESHGRLSRATDPQGHLLGATQYSGTNGNRSRDSLPGNRVTTYGYDGFGRATTVSQAGVPTRTTTYDAINRVLTWNDSVNANPTRYFYNALRLDSVMDPATQVYRFTYNALGWITARTDPVGASETMQFDRDGVLRRWTNRRNQSIDYTYDVLHRPLTKSGTNTTSESWSYTISGTGQVVTATSPVVTETSYLGVNGFLDSTRTVMASQTFWQRFHHNTIGQLDTVRITNTSVGFTPRYYGYSSATGALTGIQLGSTTTTITQDNDGLMNGVTLPGGEQVTRGHYALHGVADVGTNAPYAATVARDAAYDVAGHVQRQTVPGAPGGTDYFYDGLERLRADSAIAQSTPTCSGGTTGELDENGNPCVYNGSWYRVNFGHVFSYDAAGNRTDSSGHYSASHPGTYTTGNRITYFGGCSYATDADGNDTLRTCPNQTVRFSWSAENRLTGMTVNSATIAFQYDASGRLVRRDSAGSAQRHFLWQGDNLTAELGGSATSKVGEYSYYGLDRLHAFIVDTTPYYAHSDVLGNITALTTYSQGVARTYDYDAWGTGGGNDYQPFNGADRARFKGALWMGPEVDLYFMRSRFYEPQSGRFLSEDPIGLEGGLNPTVFAHDDPVNFADPTGTEECPSGTNAEVEKKEDGTPTGYILCKDRRGGVVWRIPTSSYTPQGPDRRGQPTRGSSASGCGTAGLRSMGFGGFWAVLVGEYGSTGPYATKAGEGGMYVTQGVTFGLGAGVGAEAQLAGSRASTEGRSWGICGQALFGICVTANSSGFNVNVGFGPGVGVVYVDAETRLMPAAACRIE